MATPAFTPGPWGIEGYGFEAGQPGKYFIVSHGVNAKGDGPAGYLGRFFISEADARLIAAAPTMYAALGEIAAIANELSWDAKSRAIAERLHAITGPARAKAEGR